MDVVSAILAAVAALAFGVGAGTVAPDHNPAGPSIPPCVYEDGSGGPVPCYWDASERGNGIGQDVIVTVAP